MKKIFENSYEQDEFFRKWLIGLSPRTKENYCTEYHEWHTFIGMTPTELIKKRMHDLTTENLSERLFFENKFREYKEYLEQRGNLKPLSVKTKLRTVASFFSRNGLPLALKRGDWESTQEQPVIQRWKITREEVKALYAHGNLRDRALLLVLAQSGFSEADVSNLKIESLKGIYEQPETEHYFIEKPREKTGETQTTCLSYEAVHDIKALLQERGNPIQGYLFVSTTRGKGDKLEVRTINQTMKSLAEKTFGAEKAKDFKTKALRSFYNSALLRAEIQSEIKDLMMGHARQSARKHYDYDEITIKEAYQRAFEHLSINGMQIRADLKKVMATLKGLTDTNVIIQKQLEAKDQELQTIKDELKALDSLVKQVTASDYYKEMAEGVLEKLAVKLMSDSQFAEKFLKEAEKLKSGVLKGKG
ncbi:MAG: site-specific integrase [Candidatus Bathyarchaeota archaeon]|nr:site-specific integrase [Candidatus Bathyarchaeota archaeon]